MLYAASVNIVVVPPKTAPATAQLCVNSKLPAFKIGVSKPLERTSILWLGFNKFSCSPPVGKITFPVKAEKKFAVNFPLLGSN